MLQRPTNLAECYRVLGLTPGASEAQIKKAYRDLVKAWHPDRFSADKRLQAEEKLKEINLAFERLQDQNPTLTLLAGLREAYAQSPPANPKTHVPRSAPRAPTPTFPPDPSDNAPSPEPEPSASVPFPSRNTNWKIAAIAASLLIVGMLGVWFIPNSSIPSPPETPFVPLSEITRVPNTTPMNGASKDSTHEFVPAAEFNALLQSEPAPSTTSLPHVNGLSDPNNPPHETESALPARRRSPTLDLIEKLKQTKLAPPPSPATNADPVAAAASLFERGLRHAQGTGVPQDFAEAAKWYLQAAEAGHPQAQRNLGFLFASGKGVAQDPEQAEYWLRKAAAQGVSGADIAAALVSGTRTNSSAGKPVER